MAFNALQLCVLIDGPTQIHSQLAAGDERRGTRPRRHAGDLVSRIENIPKLRERRRKTVSKCNVVYTWIEQFLHL